MQVSIHDARRTLAKAGITLGEVRREKGHSGWTTNCDVTTPVGTRLEMSAGEVLGIVRELNRYAVTA